MEVPEDFDTLCGAFYPGSDLEYATEDEWIAAIVRRFFSLDRRLALAVFLDELLRERDEVIQDTWQAGGPTFNFRPGGHRIFLTKVRDAIRANI